MPNSRLVFWHVELLTDSHPGSNESKKQRMPFWKTPPSGRHPRGRRPHSPGKNSAPGKTKALHGPGTNKTRARAKAPPACKDSLSGGCAIVHAYCAPNNHLLGLLLLPRSNNCMSCFYCLLRLQHLPDTSEGEAMKKLSSIHDRYR